MTAAVAGRAPRIRLAALGEYEPDDVPERDEAGLPLRWSSLRHGARPRLVLAAVPDGGEPVPAVMGRLIRQVLEVLDGRRPLGHLVRLLPDTALEAVLTRMRHRHSTQHVLRRLRACHPNDDVVEVAAVVGVSTPERRAGAIAAAARFERDGAGWRCAVLRFV
jgi:uncharacterized protein DUF6459